MMLNRVYFRLSLSLPFVLLAMAYSQADVVFLAKASVPGTATDLSGLKETLSDGTPHNRLGGLGSGIAYTGQNQSYVLVSDRGPKDGTVDYLCRFHTMEIIVDPRKQQINLKLLGTTLLQTEDGKKLNGALSYLDRHDPAKSLRFDPEGVRVGPKGTIFISDEYGPSIQEFDAKGKRLRSLPIPMRYLASHPSSKVAEELPPHNNTGRQPNHGMEGLAISPDGTILTGIIQNPLLQDGALDAAHKKTGTYCRILQIHLPSGTTKEFVYELDSPSNGLSEILALNDHQFLVIERDSKSGAEARYKKIQRIDLQKATDISQVDRLPARHLPASITPVAKENFLDLLDPKYQLAGRSFPAKIEGLAFGPDLPDGRHLLLITSDNDFVATKDFTVFAFAIDRASLPGYQPQSFPKR